MNWYEHHIGDYDKNTAHLTACEDGIYCRLIRRYYDKEAPLPADVEKVKRLARARDEQERKAVDDVLDEFFTLEADGWHHKVCDEVIAAYKAGEPEREAKKRNEDTRLARHRQERADLFAELNAAGQHLPYNVKIDELRKAVGAIRTGKPATAPETAPATPETGAATPATPPATVPAMPVATAPATLATATQPPLPNHQPPVPNLSTSSCAEPAAQLDADPMALVRIPLADGTEFPVLQSHIDEWATAFPGVDVVGELRKARVWCLDNPTKRKTKRGARKFLGGWLSREQDRGGSGLNGSNGSGHSGVVL